MNPVEIRHPMSRIATRRDRRHARSQLVAAVGLALVVGALAGVAGYLQSRLPAVGDATQNQLALLSVPDTGPLTGSVRATEFERQKTDARSEPLPDQF